MLALGISTVLYVVVSIVAVSVLGATALAASEHPLTDVMREAIGGVSVKIIAVVALATTANTTLLASTAASRMIYSMGDTGGLPARWGQVHQRQSPRMATVVVICAAGVLSVLGGLQLLASATNALVYAMFLVVNVVVIILRKRQPDAERPFRIPLSVGWLPVVPCLGIIATLTMSAQLELKPLLVALALLAGGGLAYVIGQVVSARRTAQ